MRTQIKKKEKNIVRIMIKKRFIGMNHIKKIYVIKKQEYKRTAYSDKKIKEKLAPEYSVLKPETNSDSDSLKSNGAR